MAGGTILSKADVEALLNNPSGESRTVTAQKLAMEFNTSDLSSDERVLAEDIFRIMVKDAEVRVRQALADNLKENLDLPRDVARALANDVDSVSLPIIQFSEVLTNEDLIEIVNMQDEEKQKAVASRRVIDETVSTALVNKGTEDAVATLISNEGAKISEASFEAVVDRFGESPKVQKPLVYRSKIPVTVAEKLVHRVSEELQKRLVTHHELPPDVATDLIMQSREKATISISRSGSQQDIRDLVAQLYKNDRLTPSIIFRAVCMGDIPFVEYAFSISAGIPVENTRVLIHDAGKLGFQSLYKKARQPDAMFNAFKAAIDVYKETEKEHLEDAPEKFSRRMIERIITFCDKSGIAVETDDLDYLISKISTRH